MTRTTPGGPGPGTPGAAGLARSVRRLRVPLALVVLVVTVLNRVVLHQVDLSRDLTYLLVGRLPAGGGTQEWPWEAPWLVLPVTALLLFVVVPRAWSWTLVVATFVLPHLYPYRIGPIELWGTRIVEFTPGVIQLLHLPLLLLLGLLAILALGGVDPAPTAPRSADLRTPPDTGAPAEPVLPDDPPTP
jgi:hypothetical protein